MRNKSLISAHLLDLFLLSLQISRKYQLVILTLHKQTLSLLALMLSKVCLKGCVFVGKSFYLPIQSCTDKVKAFIMAVKLPSVPVNTHTQIDTRISLPQLIYVSLTHTHTHVEHYLTLFQTVNPQFLSLYPHSHTHRFLYLLLSLHLLYSLHLYHSASNLFSSLLFSYSACLSLCKPLSHSLCLSLTTFFCWQCCHGDRIRTRQALQLLTTQEVVLSSICFLAGCTLSPLSSSLTSV